MTRVGKTAPAGHSWFDDSRFTCYPVNDATGYEACDRIKTCSKCLYSRNCEYRNYQCTSATSSLTLKPDTVFTTCFTAGVTAHDFSLCGPSQINLSQYNQNTGVRPSGVSLPKYTLCRYEITYSTKITDTITLVADNNSDLVVKQISNGVTTTLTPIRRVLSDGHRDLSTSTSYAVTNADSVSVYSVATSATSSSTFSVSTAKTYATGSGTTPLSSGGSSSPSNGKQSVPVSSDKSSSSSTGIIVA